MEQISNMVIMTTRYFFLLDPKLTMWNAECAQIPILGEDTISILQIKRWNTTGVMVIDGALWCRFRVFHRYRYGGWLKWGYPPSHPFFHGCSMVFPLGYRSFWGIPIYGKLHIWEHANHQTRPGIPSDSIGVGGEVGPGVWQSTWRRTWRLLFSNCYKLQLYCQTIYTHLYIL